MKVELKIKGSDVKIYIDGILHLRFVQQQLIGIQSWKEGPSWFSIEYYFKEAKPILCAYDNIDKWKAVLKQIDEKL